MTKKTYLVRLALIVVALAGLACNLGAFTKRALDIETTEEEELADPTDYYAGAVEGEPADLTPESEPEEPAEVEPTPEPTATPEPTTPTCAEFLEPGFTAIYECNGGVWQLQEEGRGKSDTRDQYTYTVSEDGVLMVERHELTYDMVVPPEPAAAEDDTRRKFTLMNSPGLCLPPEGEVQLIPESQHVSDDGEYIWTYEAYEVAPVDVLPMVVMGIELEAVGYQAQNTFSYVRDDGYNRVEQEYSRDLLFYYDAETGMLLQSESYEYLDDCSTTDDEYGYLDCPGTGLYNFNICELIGATFELGY